MAIFNEILSPRYSRFVQKVFGMKGHAALRQVAGEISPQIQVFSGVENRYLESWDLYQFASNQPAVAAQFSTVQLRNPLSSGVIGVLEMVTAFEGGADTFNLSRAFNNPADLATLVVAIAPIDSRSQQISGGGNSPFVISRTTLGASTDLGAGIQNGAVTGVNVPYQFIQTVNQELPVLPGMAYRISAQTANQSLIWSVRWRQRAIEPSELLP